MKHILLFDLDSVPVAAPSGPIPIPTAQSVAADGVGVTWGLNGFVNPGTVSVERYASILTDDGGNPTGFTEDWAVVYGPSAATGYSSQADTHADDLYNAGTYGGFPITSVGVNYRVVFTGDGTTYEAGTTTSDVASVNRPA